MKTDSDVDNEEEHEVSFHDIKDKIHAYSKQKFISLSGVLIDAYQKIFAEKERVINDYALYRFDNKDLEISKENLKFSLLI